MGSCMIEPTEITIRNPLGRPLGCPPVCARAVAVGAIINAVAGTCRSGEWVASDGETIAAFKERVRIEAAGAKFLIWEIVR
jgi:hypothetical protein